MVTESTGAATGVFIKPGVGSSYSNGWRQLWKSAHFGWLLLILIIVGALSFIPSFFQALVSAPASAFTMPFETPYGAMPDPEDLITFIILYAFMVIFSILYSVFFLDPLGYGVKYAFLRAARNDSLSVENMFACFKNYWNAVGASVVVGLIVGFALLFLIAPGIYLACKLAFVPYLVIDRRMNLGDAFSASWKLTDGHGWKVFLIGLLSVPITIAGFICLVVGVVIAEMWVKLAFASLYHAVSLEKGMAAGGEAANAEPAF